MGAARRKAQVYVRNLADREFQQAHEDGVELKCRRPGAWRYYIGFKPNDRPSPEGARRLCEGIAGTGNEPCPILEACDVFVHNLPPGIADGVWAGKVWIDGVIQAD